MLWASSALALPSAPAILCEMLPDAADCVGRVAGCETCHTSTWPASWNAYGVDVGQALEDPDDFAGSLPAALLVLSSRDADGDGVANGDELLQGTNPGDRDDAWPYCAPAPVLRDEAPLSEAFDMDRALRRLSILYCGRSPTYEERRAFAGEVPAAQYARMHEALDACLASTYWRDEGLPRIADAKIRPIASVGIDSPVGIVIGDYEWDYRLFSYVLTEDRDARDLLLADYHVDVVDGRLVRVDGLVSQDSGSGPQPLVVDRRAGMLTTQWFLSVNTMFSALPRTTAAQAYRAYLGMDIARLEGIVPVAGEPLDVDDKGVQRAECASCHSTLDPLSYAFASYNGIGGGLDRIGTYDPARPTRMIDDWEAPATFVFGQPVEGVRGWAEVAAESEAFQRTLALMFFRHALEREPSVDELSALAAAWRALPEDGYSANRFLHRLIDQDAFGRPQ